MIMTYYEIKKVFSKKGSKVALIFIFIVISVISMLDYYTERCVTC